MYEEEETHSSNSLMIPQDPSSSALMSLGTLLESVKWEYHMHRTCTEKDADTYFSFQIAENLLVRENWY